MIVEVLRFRLAAGVDEVAFLEADKRVQTEFAYLQPGMVRRTTARADDGEWVVIDLWRSREDADSCDNAWGKDPVTEEFMRFVDRASVKTETFETLD